MVKVVVTLAMDVTDEDIDEGSTWPTLEVDGLDGPEVVVCDDSDVVSGLLNAFATSGEIGVDGRKGHGKRVGEGWTGLSDDREAESEVCLTVCETYSREVYTPNLQDTHRSSWSDYQHQNDRILACSRTLSESKTPGLDGGMERTKIPESQKLQCPQVDPGFQAKPLLRTEIPGSASKCSTCNKTHPQVCVAAREYHFDTFECRLRCEMG